MMYFPEYFPELDMHTQGEPKHPSDVRAHVNRFKPWRGPDGFLHYPERLTDGAMFCACGKQFACDPTYAPTDQQWPKLWAGFQEFLEHVREKGWSECGDYSAT